MAGARFATPLRTTLRTTSCLTGSWAPILALTSRQCTPMASAAALLPEVDRLYGVPQRAEHHPEVDTGIHIELCLDAAGKAERLRASSFRRVVPRPGQGGYPPGAMAGPRGPRNSGQALGIQCLQALWHPRLRSGSGRLGVRVPSALPPWLRNAPEFGDCVSRRQGLPGQLRLARRLSRRLRSRRSRPSGASTTTRIGKANTCAFARWCSNTWPRPSKSSLRHASGRTGTRLGSMR